MSIVVYLGLWCDTFLQIFNIMKVEKVVNFFFTCSLCQICSKGVWVCIGRFGYNCETSTVGVQDGKSHQHGIEK
jgi:hypothetical protein